MPRPPHGIFCWNELTTNDAAAAQAFFTALLGWSAQPIDMQGTPYTMLMAGDTQAAGLFQMTEEWGEAPPHWMAYIAVDDIEATKARVEELGGTVHFGPHDAPGVGRFILIEDPTGAKVSLIQLADDTAG